ncbi:MAG: dihydroorotate dehydrogenase electron transfer subunit [Syntrophomonadaceae bacterium]|nr:dihydroorotate dehydrogenase electron transfer subunit [Syntrophomonadaceae bacterium]MDD4550250.1 dihydroorotate dehydrogenase electron transfer subunit [Syntrophomonadaceae bacterium]
MPSVGKGLVIGHHQVSDDMYEIEFILPAMSAECEPGQFVHIMPDMDNGPLLRRPLSLYDVDKKSGSITLLYKVVGQGTRLLTRVRNKDYVDVMGPLGRGFSLPGVAQNVLLIGGGVGIAPLIYLARALKELGCNIKVLYGTGTRSELVVFDKLRQIGVEIMPATMDGTVGYKGLVTDLLADKVNPSEIDFIYTCGPEPMMAGVAQFAKQNGIPGEASLEEHMACGVGACLGCARKLKAEDQHYIKVCKDGPVFSFAEIDF